MYVMKNHGFKRKYVYGGSGLFDSLARLFTSGVAKQLTSTAIDVGKEVGKRAAVDVGTVEFYESHTHTVDMFIRASEQQRQAYGYTAESMCVTITANVRILHLSPFTMNC